VLFLNQSRTQRDSPRIRNFRRLRFAAGIALLVALFSVTSAAQATITPTSTASDLASAVVNDPAVVTGASFVAATGTPNAVSTTSLTSFPTDGLSYAILTTGDSTLADQPNNSGSDGVNLGGGSVRGDTDLDVTIVKIDLAVPAGANCLALDFQFLTEEFPEFVGSSFNDAFIAELDSSTWTTSGSTITAPNNFAFDPSGDVISVNSSGVTSMTAGNASGTTYDGATPLLSAATPITAGAHSLYLSIFDQGDNFLDSAVFVDNVILGSVGPGGCEPGATVLSTSKTADSGTTPPGGANGYTITVSNPSASAVVLNSISDTLPTGFTYTAGSTTGATTADPTVSGQMLTWTGPFSAPAAGNVSLHFLVTVSSTPGEYFNDASADAGTIPVAPTGPTAKITVTSGGGTELAITKADAPDPVALGGSLTYTLTVTNNGPDSSTDSTVTDTLPAGVTFVSATPSQGTCSQAAGTVTCTLGPLAAGASATIAIVVTVDATAVCPLSDTATVTGVETDPVAANNSATASTACGGGTDLAITKADAPDPVALGGSLTYTLTVTNNGPDPSTDSTVTDTLPAGVTFVSATPSQGTCSQAAGTVTCTLGPLAPGASATIQIVVTVDPTAVSPLSDTATVTGVETDPLAANNSATAETTISPPTALDHFKCYKTRQVGTKFDPRRVVLTDQFTTERVNVVRPEAFCNPVDKDGSGINDPSAHLACYKIHDVRGDEFPKFKKERVDVTDQFGTHRLLLKKTRSLCLPASKAPFGEVPGAPPTGLDHFKCYKTRQVGTKFDPRQVLLTDQFTTERVNVVRPEAFCAPVDKDGSGINDPSAHLACYKIRDVRGDEFPKFERRRLEVGDQFGTHTLLLKKTRTLCLPSSKTVL
jgi:uncharacterized repeat protein (TIGR01451 family)